MRGIDWFNLLMSCGILVMIVSGIKLQRSNEELHAQNQRDRELDDELYGLDDQDAESAR